MQGNPILLLAALLPILCAPIAYGAGRKKPCRALWVLVLTSAATLGLLILILTHALSGKASFFQWDGFCGLGLSLCADGFRALYAAIAGFMWLVTSIFSLDYFKRSQNVGRYTFFTLITLGATVGLFLSDTLYSTFLFFEVVSFASYPWVAQEETPQAMRAAQTYLYIAVIGGLVMLMGLFLLPIDLVTASFASLPAMAQTAKMEALWLPSLLILFGFGAKAGSFPLHIWLPKAHPVAPAPASALLSGMLTKVGVFGMLVLTCVLMRGSTAFADLILRLGVITMLLGALLALFSVNLKRTLACSSLSQIGFIMVGVGLCGLLGQNNTLAAIGTVGHMLNHSLFKLVLFLCAGVVAMNTHKLMLDDIRGYGRKKPVLHFAFLMGLLGISGVPLFSGYASKSLLHEGLLEYIALLREAGANPLVYEISEWAFVLTGGLTLCYMLKLYICLFWQKHPTEQASFDAQKKALSPFSSAALALCAAMIPAIGLFPQFLTSVGTLSASFLGAVPPASAIAYFSPANLLGAGKSLFAGGVFYVLMRILLTEKGRDGAVRYLDRLPKSLDLEDGFYRPLLKLLSLVGYGLAYGMDRLMDGMVYVLHALGGLLAHVLDRSLDSIALATRKLALSPVKPPKPIPVGSRFTYALGSCMNAFMRMINKTLRRKNPIETNFVTSFAAGRKEAGAQLKSLTRSISFGLLMFCLGLYVTLAYLML
ncbi:MAG: complex I subunit 5 family protein [Clostridia bacterium]